MEEFIEIMEELLNDTWIYFVLIGLMINVALLFHSIHKILCGTETTYTRQEVQEEIRMNIYTPNTTK